MNATHGPMPDTTFTMLCVCVCWLGMLNARPPSLGNPTFISTGPAAHTTFAEGSIGVAECVGDLYSNFAKVNLKQKVLIIH